jgi:hypothetical protein
MPDVKVKYSSHFELVNIFMLVISGYFLKRKAGVYTCSSRGAGYLFFDIHNSYTGHSNLFADVNNSSAGAEVIFANECDQPVANLLLFTDA